MTHLDGFSDNPFETRLDLIRAVVALLKPLERYKSRSQARIKISTESGAGFDEVAAQLEGFARALWAVANLFQFSSTSATSEGVDNASAIVKELDISSWIQGIAAGTDPTSSEYWGDLGDFDQRMVEMESIAYALLTAPQAYSSLDKKSQESLAAWLRQINSRKMPQNNWLWFRVFVNLALGASTGTVENIDNDLNTLDTFYVGEGWSSDGLWGDERKQADYYSGSFAIQFARLLFVKTVEESRNASAYKDRIERYKDEARQFAKAFWRYFDVNGAAIPFGRSLTYRFAFAAFWSAAVVAGVTLPPPLDNLGVVKGLLLRHLRWWTQYAGIFNPDGTLNIGYTYPNMFMSENYNSPQSVYWCLKTFIIVGLPKDHPFWSCEELPHPLAANGRNTVTDHEDSLLKEVYVVWPARHILCSTKEHHFLISSGQGTGKPHRAREAKYGKLAYSSGFGFSVPTGPLLEQLAPDSTICLSIDDGDTWSVRCNPFNVHLHHVKIFSSDTVSEEIPAIRSTWKPKRTIDLEVETTLIPPVEQWPGWHIRVHRLKWKSELLASGNDALRLVDSGFAARDHERNGSPLAQILPRHDTTTTKLQTEGWLTEDDACLISSDSGSSGIVDLTPELQQQAPQGIKQKRAPMLLRADANTNLVSQRTLIPSIEFNITRAKGDEPTSLEMIYRETWLITGVFAVTSSSAIGASDIQKYWGKRPGIRLSVAPNSLESDFELVYNVT